MTERVHYNDDFCHLETSSKVKKEGILQSKTIASSGRYYLAQLFYFPAEKKGCPFKIMKNQLHVSHRDFSHHIPEKANYFGLTAFILLWGSENKLFCIKWPKEGYYFIQVELRYR